MPYRRRRARGHRRRRTRRAALIGLAVAGLACVLLVASSSLLAPGEVSDQQAAREAGALLAHVPSPSPLHAADSGGRAVYPYSVVPGGVYSREALAAAVSDPVVAEHYARIDIAHARVTTVPAPRRAYVSYRVADRVFWTKHTVALHPGEQILTDGANEIRGRCGNSISDTPQEPTSPEEPELTEFDRAIAPETGESPTWLMASEPESSGLQVDGSLPGDPGVLLSTGPGQAVGGGAPIPAALDAKNITIGGAPVQLTPVPEPGSMILLGTGLAGCAFRAWRRRRRG